MELANNILLILHFVGLASLLSGFFYQLKDWGKGMKVNAGILHGAWLQLITGMGMVGLIQAMHGTEQVNNVIVAVKSIILTVIFFVAYSFNKKRRPRLGLCLRLQVSPLSTSLWPFLVRF